MEFPNIIIELIYGFPINTPARHVNDIMRDYAASIIGPQPEKDIIGYDNELTLWHRRWQETANNRDWCVFDFINEEDGDMMLHFPALTKYLSTGVLFPLVPTANELVEDADVLQERANDLCLLAGIPSGVIGWHIAVRQA